MRGKDVLDVHGNYPKRTVVLTCEMLGKDRKIELWINRKGREQVAYPSSGFSFRGRLNENLRFAVRVAPFRHGV